MKKVECIECKNSQDVLDSFLESGEKYMELIEYTAASANNAYTTLKKYIDSHHGYNGIRLVVVQGHLVLENKFL